MIANQAMEFDYFDENGQIRKGNGWYTRITVHFIHRQVADIIVTARQDKKVHGAKDCLQLGTVISSS